MAQNLTSIGFADHDHTACVDEALNSAEAKCMAQGLRMTPVRRKVLELLLHEHKAMGAYAILDLLREAGFGSKPPVAYRALEFLEKNGFVHRIERLNAFVACAHPKGDHSPAFLICRSCDGVAEAVATIGDGSLDVAADAHGFTIERTMVEVEGLCLACAGENEA